MIAKLLLPILIITLSAFSQTLSGLQSDTPELPQLSYTISYDKQVYNLNDTAHIQVRVVIPHEHHLYGNPLGPGIGKPTTLTPLSTSGLNWLKVEAPRTEKFTPPGSEDQWVWSWHDTISFYFTALITNPDSLIASIELDGLICKDACIPLYDTIALFPQEASARPFALGQDLTPFPLGTAQTQTTPTSSAETSPILDQLKGFTTLGVRGGYLKAEPFLAFLKSPAPENSSLGDKGLFTMIFLILLGGIALNFTPCVLPMIPITLAIIGAGSQAKSRSRGFVVGGVYGSAMALTYGILGLIVVLTGTQFGTLNANPIFNFSIAGLFVVLALAMFDIIHIDFTQFRKGGEQKESSKGRFIPVFAMGVVAALLAGACVAPVVISVVLYSATLYGSGSLAGLFLPFLLGLGMALPWPFAGAGISFMPKPGNWMIVVRNLFGTFILATALYYGYLGYNTLSASPSDVAPKEDTSKIAWNSSLEQALQESQITGVPLVIDFWATWCKNCKAMDKTTFQDPEVVAELGNYIPVKFQAEDPSDPTTKAVLDHFGLVGLPSYVIIQPR